MSRTRNKQAAVWLSVVLALALVLSGCSGGSGDNGKGDQASPGTSASATKGGSDSGGAKVKLTDLSRSIR